METCEVCERSGKAAARCAFGHVSGVCSCWRSVPCDGKTGRPARAVVVVDDPSSRATPGTIEGD